MAEVEFRFPGEAPYTYFNVSGTPEELTQINYEMLAALYVNAQKAVIVGSIQAKQAIAPKPQAPASEPVAAAVADSAISQAEAAGALDKGLDGATEIDDVNAPPWEGPAPAAKPKPWENKKPQTEVSSDELDF